MRCCASCGHQNPSDARACTRCALALDTRCPACGRWVPVASRTCVHCGTHIDLVPSTSLPPSYDAQVHQTLRALMPDSLASRIGTAEIVGERREVTVLAVGFDVEPRLDSEALYILTDEVIRCLARVIYEYEGTIDRYTDGGLVAMFGLPITHENDAERAVHAAIEMSAALQALRSRVQQDHRAQIAVRIGVHTGPVIAGPVHSDLRVDH